jgi:two-component system, response regulator
MNQETRTILLVEDSMQDAELAMEALATQNLTEAIVHARDGAEALDYLHCRGSFAERPVGNPALIILDLKLPKVDGIEVLQEVRSDEHLKHVPVVVFTSSREERDLEACYRLGVSAYVVKPVDFADYMKAVKALGLFWATVNEPPPRSLS